MRHLLEAAKDARGADDDDDELQDDAERFGIELEEEEIFEEGDADAFEVWQENVDALVFFALRLQTQWRIAAGFGFVRFIGLDWAGVEHKMNLFGVKRGKRAELAEQLEVIEQAALKVLNRAANG